VQYRLAGPGPVRLEMFDARGRLVRTLVDGIQESGDHWVDLNATGLGSGAYFYKLQWNGQETTQRCVLLR
jgi:hypothetical protein